MINPRGKRGLLLFLIFYSILLIGCSSKGGNATAKHDGPPRDNTPSVLVPDASGAVTYGTDTVAIDVSNTSEGYFMVKYTGTCPKVKLQIQAPTGVTYTFLLSSPGNYETFPLSEGNGTYKIDILENVNADFYAILFTQTFDAAISDEFKPFLYPNQYVSFNAQSKTVAKAAELGEGSYSDLETLQSIYEYVIKNIEYDDAKAAAVTAGYLPNIDETLDSGMGICFDYASVISAMLRSQRIPTKLEVGYSGEIYHAWISTYIDGIGWIDNIIEFDGNSWKLLDPTLAANNSKKEVGKYVGDGSHYVTKYIY